ncbi:hypothetical protein GCM10023156_57950 [Novipirellula rosea]|uniref:Uncharacterized protein n=1 Tax=Novipirellula rosea TaxID=1031540 RepID=A0ABP8NIP5_9BACT
MVFPINGLTFAAIARTNLEKEKSYADFGVRTAGPSSWWVADAVQVVSAAQEEIALRNRDRCHRFTVQLVGGDPLEFRPRLKHRGDAFFGGDIDSAVR